MSAALDPLSEEVDTVVARALAAIERRRKLIDLTQYKAARPLRVQAPTHPNPLC